MEPGRRGWARAIGLGAAAAVAALVVAAGIQAAANPTLTIQVAPGTISAGQPALAIGTLTNPGPSTLTHAVITFGFPSTVSVTAPGCSPSSGAAASVVCPLGTLKAGAAAVAVITFIAPGSTNAFQATGRATWDAGTQSKGSGGRNDAVTATAAPAQIFASNDETHKGTCATGPGNLDAELNGQGTELTTLPVADPSLGLPCTPLAVGVEAKPGNAQFTTDIAIVDVPKLQQPATVELTFRDEQLPGSVDNPSPLRELTNPTDLNPSTFVVVPACTNGGTTIPSGFDSCIVSVAPDDPDGDADAGVITLLVQGSGLGDPRYVG